MIDNTYTQSSWLLLSFHICPSVRVREYICLCVCGDSVVHRKRQLSGNHETLVSAWLLSSTGFVTPSQKFHLSETQSLSSKWWIRLLLHFIPAVTHNSVSSKNIRWEHGTVPWYVLIDTYAYSSNTCTSTADLSLFLQWFANALLDMNPGKFLKL